MDVGLKKASEKIEKKLLEVIKLKHKWDKIYNQDYQRAKKPERIAKLDRELDNIEDEIKDIVNEINDISREVRRCIELLEEFHVRTPFDTWKPEDSLAYKRCKDLLYVYKLE